MSDPSVTTVITLGTTGAIEQPSAQTSDPRTGAQTTRRWHGKIQDLLFLFPQLSSAGWVFTVNPISPILYELVATIGYAWTNSGIADNAVDVWDLTSNKVEKDLLSIDNPVINALSQADKQLIRATLEQAPATIPATLTGPALSVYQDMKDGFDHYPVFQPVLRRTRTVSGQYATAQAEANIGKIISGDSMVGSEGVPASLVGVPIPSATTTKTGYAYGWLKDYPNITIAAFQKTQIHQDYLFGYWPTAYFNIPL